MVVLKYPIDEALLFYFIFIYLGGVQARLGTERTKPYWANAGSGDGLRREQGWYEPGHRGA